MISKTAFLALVWVAGAAAAQSPANVMHVPLADGSSVRIEYHGDIAPKVAIEPKGRDHVERTIERRIERRDARRDRIRQLQSRAREESKAATSISVSDLPEGASSVSVVSVNTPAGMCTRTTRVTSQGAGKPPLVVTEAKGNCEGVELPAVLD